MTDGKDFHRLVDVDCKNDLVTAELAYDQVLDELLTDLSDVWRRLEKLEADAAGVVHLDRYTLFDVTECLLRAIHEVESLGMNWRTYRELESATKEAHRE